MCGVASALAVTTLEFKLKLPGHSILRAVFPMAFGLALVPRVGAGTVMGIGAATASILMTMAGWGERGLGAVTSLYLIGPCLDLAVCRAKSGRWIYLSLVSAGLMANLAAMAVQVTAKSMGWKVQGMGKSLAEWLPWAAITYPLCGILAGLLSAVVWFRWNSGRQHPTDARS